MKNSYSSLYNGLFKYLELDNILIKDSKKSYSKEDLFEFIKIIDANFYKIFGKKKSKKIQTICILAKPNFNSVVFIIYCFIKGIKLIILNNRLQEDELNEQIKKAKVEIVVSNFNSNLSNINISNFFKKIKIKNHLKICKNINKEALVLFTSGSTANAKGVVLTKKNILANVVFYKQQLNPRYGESYMLSLPFFHIGGLMIIFRCLFLGLTIVLPKEVKLKYIKESLKRNNIDYISLVQTQLLEMHKDCKKELRKAKRIILGGSSFNEKIINQAIKHKFLISVSYGMTELTSTLCLSEKLKKYKINYAGIVSKNSKITLNKKNEIIVKGDNVFKRYLGYRRKIGGFATGDLGKIVDKKLYVLGRKDRMFISGGENIYPEEIEKTIMKFSKIKEVVVLSREHPKWGQRPIAYCVFNKSPKKNPKEKLIIFLRKKLAKYKIPDDIIILNNLPKLANGKIDYRMLKNTCIS